MKLPQTKIEWRRVTLVAGITIALGITFIIEPASNFVWNATHSFPVGLYYLKKNPELRVGEVVYFSSKDLSIARERGYIPENGLFMKKIGAMPGQRYCVLKDRFQIDGQDYGPVFSHDLQGRALNPKHGCEIISDGMFLPISSHPRSFDGRYIGTQPLKEIKGQLIPILVKKES